MKEPIDPNVCRGLFGPCPSPITHHLEDPDGGPSIPLCDEHWECARMLEEALGENPEFAKRFADAVAKAERSEIPTRYERKPVI